MRYTWRMKRRLSDIINNLDWINTLFLTLTPLAAIFGTAFVIYNDMLRWPTIVLFAVLSTITGISITGGYHRLFAHKSYEANKLVRFLALMFGAAAFQNSARKWSSDHRIHHQFTDTEKDPYTVKRGFWHAHILWVFEKRNAQRSAFDNVPDLDADPLIQFQDKHIFKIGALFGLFLPMALGALWGDPWGGLFIAGFARVVLNHHFTFFINSLCHIVGNQPYSTKDTSRDNWVMALFTYGEGYHNFHHSFPSDYRNGIKAYQWDPTKWAIWLGEKMGLAHNLKRIPTEKPQLQRIALQERRFMDLVRTRHSARMTEWHEKITERRERFEKSYLHFLEVKREYIQLKKQSMQEFNDQVHERYFKLKEDCRQAKENFRAAAQEWASLQSQLVLVRA